VGDTFLLTEIVAGPYAGNEMPYAPRHSVWWEAGWEAESGLTVSVDGWWEAEQFSDERNTVEENSTGSIGLIPAFTVWNLRAGWKTEIDENWSIDLRVGVKNLFDEDYWYRSDDINAGILPSRSRTFYSAMGVRWVQ
jgi:Fe(3+) dicitrate transport protein